MGVRYPRIPGHEIAGIIDYLGPGVTEWKIGDRVGVSFHGGHCFTCEFCRVGDFVNCANLQITGISFDGGYAEYVVAPQAALARIPAKLSFSDAAPLMCAGMTTFNALRHSGANPGDTVAIVGLGGLGHLAVQFASKMGFRTVVVAREKDREPVAKALGANAYIQTSGDPLKKLMDLGGASVILATAPSSELQASLIQALRPNGRMIILAGDPE